MSFMVLSLSAFSQDSAGEKRIPTAPEAGATAEAGLPHFVLKDVNGANVNLQNFQGKKVFVNLWASWCPPCRVEMPSIQKLARSVDTGKVAFVLLSLDDRFEKAKSYMQREGIELPIYQLGGPLPALFFVPGIPATLIFDEKGALLRRIEGMDNYDTADYRNLLQ